MSKQKSTRRFNYNLGVYDIKRLESGEWISALPPIAGSYSHCLGILHDIQKSDQEGNYDLFHLEENKEGGIKWISTSTNRHYHTKNKDALLRLFYQLNLQLDDRGYGVMSDITQISRHTLEKLNRRPEDERFTALTPAGLLYIRFCVQEYKKNTGENHAN